MYIAMQHTQAFTQAFMKNIKRCAYNVTLRRSGVITVVVVNSKYYVF